MNRDSCAEGLHFSASHLFYYTYMDQEFKTQACVTFTSKYHAVQHVIHLHKKLHTIVLFSYAKINYSFTSS